MYFWVIFIYVVITYSYYIYLLYQVVLKVSFFYKHAFLNNASLYEHEMLWFLS